MIRVFFYLFLIIVLFLYLRYFEHKSLYYPSKDIESTPGEIGLKFEDVYIDTDDGVKINGWFIPAEKSKHTLLYCHGNGGNLSSRIDKLSIMRDIGVNIFVFDYRGYGKSNGRPSEAGLYEDAESAYKYLIHRKKIFPDNIIIYGESLGGAVAIDLASKKNKGSLITESTFTSTKDMAKMLYPFFPDFMVFSKYDSINKINNISIPKLIIHSKEDALVPFGQSIRLYNASRDPKKHLVISGDHNDCCIDSKEEYISGIRKFLDNI